MFVNNTFDSVLFAGVFNGLTNTDVKFAKNKLKFRHMPPSADRNFPGWRLMTKART
jgi:hypothetical protein